VNGLNTTGLVIKQTNKWSSNQEQEKDMRRSRSTRCRSLFYFFFSSELFIQRNYIYIVIIMTVIWQDLVFLHHDKAGKWKLSMLQTLYAANYLS